MEKSTRSPISLYSVVVTLVCVAMFTLQLKQCNEPVIATTDIQHIIDSVQKRDLLTTIKIEILEDSVKAQDRALQSLRKAKGKTRIVYSQAKEKVVEVIKETRGCDSLVAAVNSLMELADEHQLITDSMITTYDAQLKIKDSIISLRADLYAALRKSLDEGVQAYADKSFRYAKAEKKLKRDKWILGALAVVAGVFIIKQ